MRTSLILGGLEYAMMVFSMPKIFWKSSLQCVLKIEQIFWRGMSFGWYLKCRNRVSLVDLLVDISVGLVDISVGLVEGTWIGVGLVLIRESASRIWDLIVDLSQPLATWRA